jgi:hypothetical protein
LAANYERGEPIARQTGILRDIAEAITELSQARKMLSHARHTPVKNPLEIGEEAGVCS